MINFASIREGYEEGDRDNHQKCAQDIGLLGRWEMRLGPSEEIVYRTRSCYEETNGLDCECIEERVQAEDETKADDLARAVRQKTRSRNGTSLTFSTAKGMLKKLLTRSHLSSWWESKSVASSSSRR